MFELTISFETNFEQAHNRKKLRYTQLKSDIEDSGYICHNVPFKVGSRGHLSPDNRSNLATIHGISTPKLKLKNFIQTISK